MRHKTTRCVRSAVLPILRRFAAPTQPYPTPPRPSLKWHEENDNSALTIADKH